MVAVETAEGTKAAAREVARAAAATVMAARELQEPHRDTPAASGVPVVGERADLEVLAGCGGRPLGGGPVVGERGCGAVVPAAVAVGGDLRPRAEVCIARVDLDVLREGWGAPVCVTVTAKLPVPAAPGVAVVKREDEVDVVGAVHAVSIETCTGLGCNRPPPPARLRCGGGSPCNRHCAPPATSSPWAATAAARAARAARAAARATVMAARAAATAAVVAARAAVVAARAAAARATAEAVAPAAAVAA
eukprot:scaffold91811_cov42-Phaeocystis_antarctica.AAC.1